MTKINKIKLQWAVGIVLSFATLTGLGYTYILEPQIYKCIDAKNMNLNDKIDAILIKVDELDRKTTASQSANDIKFESIDGKLNLIQFRLDARK